MSTGVVIRLRNLPLTAGTIDIRRFFSGLSIPDGGVHIIGGDDGTAFILFSTDEDARQAMLRDEQKIGPEKIKLMLSSHTEMRLMIEESQRRYEVLRGLRPPEPPITNLTSRSSATGGNSETSAGNEFYIELKGMPLDVTAEDVTNFFGNLPFTAFRLMKDDKGSPTGQAFVKFKSAAYKIEALKKDHDFMGPRFVRVISATDHQWVAAGSQPCDTVRSGADGYGNRKRAQNTTPSNEGTPKRSRALSPIKYDNCVELRGLPSSTTFKMVDEFFFQLQLVDGGLFVELDGRSCRGRAFAEFVNAKDYKEALQKDGEILDGKQIRVIGISRQAMAEQIKLHKKYMKMKREEEYKREREDVERKEKEKLMKERQLKEQERQRQLYEEHRRKDEEEQKKRREHQMKKQREMEEWLARQHMKEQEERKRLDLEKRIHAQEKLQEEERRREAEKQAEEAKRREEEMRRKEEEQIRLEYERKQKMHRMEEARIQEEKMAHERRIKEEYIKQESNANGSMKEIEMDLDEGPSPTRVTEEYPPPSSSHYLGATSAQSLHYNSVPASSSLEPPPPSSSSVSGLPPFSSMSFQHRFTPPPPLATHVSHPQPPVHGPPPTTLTSPIQTTGVTVIKIPPPRPVLAAPPHFPPNLPPPPLPPTMALNPVVGLAVTPDPPPPIFPPPHLKPVQVVPIANLVPARALPPPHLPPPPIGAPPQPPRPAFEPRSSMQHPFDARPPLPQHLEPHSRTEQRFDSRLREPHEPVHRMRHPSDHERPFHPPFDDRQHHFESRPPQFDTRPPAPQHFEKRHHFDDPGRPPYDSRHQARPPPLPDSFESRSSSQPPFETRPDHHFQHRPPHFETRPEPRPPFDSRHDSHKPFEPRPPSPFRQERNFEPRPNQQQRFENERRPYEPRPDIQHPSESRHLPFPPRSEPPPLERRNEPKRESESRGSPFELRSERFSQPGRPPFKTKSESNKTFESRPQLEPKIEAQPSPESGGTPYKPKPESHVKLEPSSDSKQSMESKQTSIEFKSESGPSNDSQSQPQQSLKSNKESPIKQNSKQKSQQSSFFVRIANSPFETTEKDVRNFFQGLTVAPSGVQFVMRNNRKSGHIFVKFISAEDAEKAAKKHQSRLGGREVLVQRTSPVNMREILRKYDVRGLEKLFPNEPVPNQPPKPEVVPQDFDKSLEESILKERLTCVRIANVPQTATVTDIFKSFPGISIIPDGVHMLEDRDGKCNGNAFVELVTSEDCVRATNLHGAAKIQGSVIRVMPVKLQDMKREIGENRAKNFGGPPPSSLPPPPMHPIHPNGARMPIPPITPPSGFPPPTRMMKRDLDLLRNDLPPPGPLPHELGEIPHLPPPPLPPSLSNRMRGRSPTPPHMKGRPPSPSRIRPPVRPRSPPPDMRNISPSMHRRSPSPPIRPHSPMLPPRDIMRMKEMKRRAEEDELHRRIEHERVIMRERMQGPGFRRGSFEGHPSPPFEGPKFPPDMPRFRMDGPRFPGEGPLRPRFSMDIPRFGPPMPDPVPVKMSNLSFHVTQEDIIEFFIPFSPLPRSVRLMFNNMGKLTGEGYIAFPNMAAADAAIKNLNQVNLLNRKIKLELAI